MDYSSVKRQIETGAGKTESAKRIRALSLRLGGRLAALLIVIFAGLFLYLPASVMPMKNQSSLFGGPAGVTLLAVLVALSAYLRSVAGTADTTRKGILIGEDKMYPAPLSGGSKDERIACTEARLDALQDSYEKLQVAAYLLIALTIALLFRLMAEAVTRLDQTWHDHAEHVFRVTDATLLAWVIFAFFGLIYMHREGRLRDDVIRFCAEACLRDLGPQKAQLATDANIAASQNRERPPHQKKPPG
jgi:hypothetical protein